MHSGFLLTLCVQVSNIHKNAALYDCIQNYTFIVFIGPGTKVCVTRSDKDNTPPVPLNEVTNFLTVVILILT